MFNLASPWLLLLLPIPWLVRYCLPRAEPKQSIGLKVPFFQEISKIVQISPQKQTSNTRTTWLAYLTWILLIFALSGPQWLGDPQSIPQRGRDLMIALDLSGSMQLPDLQVDGEQTDRLTAIKSVAHQFIHERQGDRLGLILFGSRAYLQTPLTFDRKTVQHMLDDASIGLAGPQTAIGDAIGLAIKRLTKQANNSRVLVLLTDGANNSGNVLPKDAAKLAAENHIRIYTIGLGADELTIRGVFGTQRINPSADLDEESLKDIAKITGGRYFRAKNTRGLKKIYDQLNQLEPISHDTIIFRPVKPLYPWPLSMAFILSIGIAICRLARARRRLPHATS